MDNFSNFLKKDISRRKFLEIVGKVGITGLTMGVINYQPRFAWGSFKVVPIASDNPSIVWHESRCVKCGKCVGACKDVQTVLGYYDSSGGKIICVNCGQCALTCPKGAITERDDISKVWQALNDSEMHVVVQTSPASRVSLGEEFGLKAGTIVEGKQVTALKKLGFDAVFDTSFAADLTIMEEATELVKRLKGEINKPVPQFTSCSPGWVKFCEHFYPELLPNMSTCKSPQQMLGAVVKTYYAQKKGIDPSKIFTVSIMPCTAKKFECQRPEMNDSGMTDMNAVLTTRELARMIKQKNIDFTKLGDTAYDSVLGEKTGAGVIFGSSGGVMEAAVRTAYYLLTNQTPPDQLLNFTDVRGLTGIKESSVDIPGFGKLNVAVCQGLGNGRKVLDLVKGGNASWHFIEFMACPGGCVGGGGQPKTTDNTRSARANSLYKLDSNAPKRLSYENQEVQKLYQEYLGQPLSDKAHKLLHTEYVARGV
ncbi:hydrogenase [Desulforamulus profundi]|uniref:Hydrogenase n=1 Tax=Desulforamulus profundi TaxID=1383067 RepID=A0A2C6L1V6_9FIRM|nr:[FeFe] hydrogenase, group A [Desulforamulus profundi]PHJ37441.1 hydrogenase [Desulforamulus profundi]